MKRNTWYGVDCNNKESLFGYGFLMKYAPKEKEYKVVYLSGFDESGDPMFNYSWFNFESWKEELKDGLNNQSWINTSSLANFSGLNPESYIQSVNDRPETLLSDLLSYYGTSNIFGCEYQSGYTKNEILKRLNKALN